jgi:putative heme iron utilization protein
MRSFAAIDLHSNNGVLTVIDENDRVLRQKKLANQLELIRASVSVSASVSSRTTLTRCEPRSHGRFLERCIRYHREMMNQHASSSPPSTVPEPGYAERVRTLLDQERVGTLATQSVRHPGWPFASVMPYAVRPDGSPILLISGMAIHTQNLLADRRASLLIMQSGAGSDPLGSARATLMGSVERVQDAPDSLRDAYLACHPEARHWIDYSDFSFFQLRVTDVYFVGGFGVMGWVASGEYEVAEADPLAGAAAGIIGHMNNDHAEALRQITAHFGKADAEEATMVAVDRLGFVVRARTAEGVKGLRINFPEPARSREDARRLLVAMTREARGE